MTLYDFIELLTEDMQDIELWDCDEEKVVYKGMANDIPTHLGYREIQGIDSIFNPTTTITINI